MIGGVFQIVSFVLVCCTCDKKNEVIATKAPSFGFELYSIVKDAGWTPAYDNRWGRVLVFCSDECCKKQLTKGGWFRKRLIQVKKTSKD